MVEFISPLSLSCVPIVNSGILEDYAAEVLKDALPEALCSPPAVDVERFIELYLGLTIEYKRLCYDVNVLGVTAFSHGFITVLNEQTAEVEHIEVDAGTVIINPALLERRALPRLRFTLMHEASHWMLHQKAFSAENLFLNNARYHSQLVAAKEGNIDYGRKRQLKSDSDFLERQADFLASALLMPKPALRKAIIGFFRYYGVRPQAITLSGDSFLDLLAKQLPGYVAGIFQVSRRAADIRLRKLGMIVDKVPLEDSYV